MSFRPLPSCLPGDPFADFEFTARRTVLAAISGGSDSTALLHLLKTHLDSTAPATQLVAATVDHGLRPESRGEAQSVARACARLGVPHRLLTWSGAKPPSGLASAARNARYDLLATAARRVGSDLIVTGHTLDDQIETVAMRHARGPGIGLAGMAPATLYDGRVWIARPLLGMRREALRGILREAGLGWIDDPSNSDPRFERPRTRAALGMDAAVEAEEELIGIAAAARREREALGIAAGGLIARHVTMPLSGLFHADPEFLSRDAEVGLHALRILLAVAGGTDYLPNAQQATALLAALRQPPHRATLSHAQIASRRDGLWLCRETRGLLPPQPVRDDMIWDGRFRIVMNDDCDAASVTPQGMAVARRCEISAGLPASLARAAIAATPMMSRSAAQTAEGPRTTSRQDATRDDAIRCLPGGDTILPVAAPWARFLPSFDLAAARAVAALIGAAPIPEPPCGGHIVTRA